MSQRGLSGHWKYAAKLMMYLPLLQQNALDSELNLIAPQCSHWMATSPKEMDVSVDGGPPLWG
eukprot:2599349-Pyramimonas_sp.AAC.1